MAKGCSRNWRHCAVTRRKTWKFGLEVLGTCDICMGHGRSMEEVTYSRPLTQSEESPTRSLSVGSSIPRPGHGPRLVTVLQTCFHSTNTAPRGDCPLVPFIMSKDHLSIHFQSSSNPPSSSTVNQSPSKPLLQLPSSSSRANLLL